MPTTSPVSHTVTYIIMLIKDGAISRANVSNKFYKGNQFSGFCAVTSKKNGRKKEKEDQASY